MKNTPDEIIEVVSAFKAGKRIQCRDAFARDDWDNASQPSWNFGVYQYRIAPEPKLRPWKPEEVPVGALLRWKQRPDRNAMAMITSVNSGGFGGGGFSRTFREAAFDGGGDEHSTDGGKTWKPCGVEE